MKNLVQNITSIWYIDIHHAFVPSRQRLFALILACIASIGVTFAESGKCGENLTWHIENCVLTISGTGPMDDYECSSYDEYECDAPWYNNHNRHYISALIIEDGVTSIGNRALWSCIGLTSVTIPNSVTSIGDEAFYDCEKLTSVYIPNSVTYIGDRAFSGCDALTSITIPNSVTSIGDGAFKSCDGLIYLTIHYGATFIGDSAFSDCQGLTYVEIPNSVTSIGEGTFSNCDNIWSVAIPNSVTSIGRGAFEGCYGLRSPLYNDNIFAYLPRNYRGNYTIPYGIETIAGEAFYDCEYCTSITIPNSVKNFDEGAFYGCRHLRSPVYNGHVFAYLPKDYSGEYVIPYGIETVAKEAFAGCRDLTSVTIPNTVTSIGVGAFTGCTSLASPVYNNHVFVYLPKGHYSYWYPNEEDYSDRMNVSYHYYETYSIPDGIEIIADSAFVHCSGLTSITIPSSVKSIGDGAFYGCEKLTSIKLPNNVTYIGDGAFKGCENLTSVTIPNSVKYIGVGAFKGCGKLTSPLYNNHMFAYMPENYSGAYTIPKGIETVSGGAFFGCTSMTSLSIPNSVTSIGDRAFYDCERLTSVTIPNSVTSIGDSAFVHCSGLNSITIPSSVKSIGDGAFARCYSLKSPVYNDYMFAYMPWDYSGAYKIPEGIEIISGRAFAGCRYLTSVSIPNSVTSIGDEAFYDCEKLTSVYIPNSVTYIGDRAFEYCRGLTSIICFSNTPPAIGSDSLYYHRPHASKYLPKAILYVPAGYGDVYKNTPFWKDFRKIEEIQITPAILLSSELDAANKRISQIVQQHNEVINRSPYTQYLNKNERNRYLQTYSPMQIPDAYDYDQAKAFCDSLQSVANSLSQQDPTTTITSIKDYLRTTRPDDFVKAYFKENPTAKAHLESEHKEYRCHYASFTDFVIQYEQGRMQPSERNCRELKWQEYKAYYNYNKKAFDADYDKGDEHLEALMRREQKWAEYEQYYSSREAFDADYKKGEASLEAHKKREQKWADCSDYYAARYLFDFDYNKGETVVDAYRASIDAAWSSLHQLPEKILVRKSLKGARDSKKAELLNLVSLYHRLDPSPVFQLRAADFLISHNKKMGKEYKKKGSSFSSKIEFVNAYFADYYKSEAEEDKRVEREIKRIERKHKLAAKRANHEPQRQEQKTVVTTHSWNTIKDTDASALTSSSSALDNPYFENNGRVQFTWFGLDGYVGTSTGGVISILDWRFTYLEISPLAVGYNYIPEYAANLNWPALGRSSEGFYYQPSLKFYIPLGSTGSHALTLAGGARLMIEDLRSIRTLSFYDPWFMAEIGYNFNAGLINTNVFARYNGDFVIGLQLKLCHVFTPKQQ